MLPKSLLFKLVWSLADNVPCNSIMDHSGGPPSEQILISMMCNFFTPCCVVLYLPFSGCYIQRTWTTMSLPVHQKQFQSNSIIQSLPQYIRRIVNYPQMDLEYTFTQMVCLCTNPSKVYVFKFLRCI